jgi:hypothetical protein
MLHACAGQRLQLLWVIYQVLKLVFGLWFLHRLTSCRLRAVGSGSWVMMRSDHHVGHQCVFILLFIIDSSHAAACSCVLRLKGLSGVALTLTF